MMYGETSPVDIRRITMTALMAALIFVLTAVPRIPVPATGGYVHLGDAGIAFAAYAFGPGVAAVAGGVGTALADLLGFPQWAIFSLLVHGIQGLAMGAIVQKQVDLTRAILAIAVGTGIVVAGYFVAGVILEGAAVAAFELLPNALQGLSGGLLGTPLYLAARAAYPPLKR
jgi:uncharacterized membrane protein